METQEKSLASQVDEIAKGILYSKEEAENAPKTTKEVDGRELTVPTDAIVVFGIHRNFGFHPEKVENHADDIRSLVERIPSDKFFDEEGGGYSFLELAETRDGELWAQHQIVEAFCAVSIAARYARWLSIPVNVLPGGVPYVAFTHDRYDEVRGSTLNYKL